MKYKELVKRIKKGEEITFDIWGGYKYYTNFKDRVPYKLIEKLRKDFIVKEFRSKISPLTGRLKVEKRKELTTAELLKHLSIHK